MKISFLNSLFKQTDLKKLQALVKVAFVQRIGKDGRGIPGFRRPGLYEPSLLPSASELICDRDRIRS